MFSMFCEPGASGLPIYLTVVFTVVFGVMLVFNSLGCFFGVRWKKRRGQTGNCDLFIHGHESVSSISFCHYNVLLPVMTLNHDAIVSSASHSHLSISLALSVWPVSPSWTSSLNLSHLQHSSFKAVTSVFHPYLLSHLLALFIYLFIFQLLSLCIYSTPLSVFYFSFLTFLCPLYFFFYFFYIDFHCLLVCHSLSLWLFYC